MKRSALIALVFTLSLMLLTGCGLGNQAPTVTFVNPKDRATVTGKNVQFEVKGEDKDLARDKQLTFFWDFGDGGKKGSPDAKVIHQYKKPGSYIVKVFAVDDKNAKSKEASIKITVENTPPTADFSFTANPPTWEAPVEVQFDGTKSIDPDALAGTAIAYSWDFDGDGKEDSKDFKPKFKYDKEGSYKVTLTVTDSDNATAKKEQTFIIAKMQSPLVTITQPASNIIRVIKGKPVNFTGRVTDREGKDFDEEDLEYIIWDFGDGTRAPGLTVQHAFEISGKTYIVVLTARRKGVEKEGRAELKVYVNIPPIAQAEAGSRAPDIGRFFKFDQGATFAEMLTEPPHNIYGSSVTLWVYRREGQKTEAAAGQSSSSIAEILVTGHAASKVCIRASVSAYQTALALPPRESDLLAAGIAYFEGTILSQQKTLEEEALVKEYKLHQENYRALNKQRIILGELLSIPSISDPPTLEDIVGILMGNPDSLRRYSNAKIGVCILQRILSKQLDSECEEIIKALLQESEQELPQKLEDRYQAFLQELDELSQALNRFPTLQSLMADYLTKLRDFLQLWEKILQEFPQDPNLLLDLEEKANVLRTSSENISKKSQDLSNQLKNLDSILRQLSEKETVKEYLRSQSLEDFVSTFKRLEAETGLVTVKELDYEVVENVRAIVAQYAAQAANLGESIAIRHQASAGQEGAVLLPFYFTSPGHPRAYNYLTIELDLSGLVIPQEVLETHQEVLVKEVKEDAERRRQFYQSQLDEFQKLKAKLEKEDPSRMIPIDYTIDFERLRIERKPEPEWVPVKVYLTHPKYLPGLIETAEKLLEEVKKLLREIEEALGTQGRLTQINYAVVLDSFLRDWDLAFISPDQSRAYDDWRKAERAAIWAIIMSKLKEQGINPQILKEILMQENVVFDVALKEDRIQVTPYFIADLSNLAFIIDKDRVIAQYLHPWGQRKSVEHPQDKIPKEVRDFLNKGANFEQKAKELEKQAKEHKWKGREEQSKQKCREANQEIRKAIEAYQQARTKLAQPLVKGAQKALEQGDIQAAVEAYKKALILDPRGTSAQLIQEWRKRQVAGESIEEAAKKNPKVCSFIQHFEGGQQALQDGVRLAQQDSLDEATAKLLVAIKEYQNAVDSIPAIADTYLQIHLIYYDFLQQLEKQRGNTLRAKEYGSQAEQWKKKAKDIDPGFVAEFEKALEEDKLVYSGKYKELKELQVICYLQNGDKHFQAGEYIKALEEYQRALEVNTKFSEPYQRAIDTYWELGMYKRALEAALLKLEDIFQGLIIKAKPLRIVNPRLRFEPLSALKYEEASLETLEVQTQEKSLTIRVNKKDILRISSSLMDDIEFLAQWLGALSHNPQQIADVGNTFADRLLNTGISLFPAEDKLARLFLTPENWGPLGLQLLKAMVYGGVSPSFIADSAVQGYPAIFYIPDLCPEENDRSTSMLNGLTIQSTAQVEPNSHGGTILGARDYLYNNFWLSSKVIEAVEYPATLEELGKNGIDLPKQRIEGNADGLAAALQILQGILGQDLSPDVRQALLNDAITLNKLGARIRVDRPQIAMLSVTLAGKPVYLLTYGEGGATKVMAMSSEVSDVLEKIEKILSVPIGKAIKGLTSGDRATLRDKLIRPLVEHLDLGQVEEDHIVVDLKGKDFALVDLPNEPLLRAVISYFLRGNRLVGVSAHSTARDVEAKLQARIDLRKLRLVFSLPWSKINWLPEEEKARIIKQYSNEIKGLRDKIGALNKKFHLNINPEEVIIDLSNLSPKDAKGKLDELFREEDSLILSFWEAITPRELEIGKGGRFTQGDIPEAPGPTPESAKRLVACTGCRSFPTGWPDAVVGKRGVLSLAFWEELSIADAFRFVNKLMDKLGEDPHVAPQAIPLLLEILQELRLPGMPIVEATPERTIA